MKSAIRIGRNDRNKVLHMGLIVDDLRYRPYTLIFANFIIPFLSSILMIKIVDIYSRVNDAFLERSIEM